MSGTVRHRPARSRGAPPGWAAAARRRPRASRALRRTLRGRWWPPGGESDIKAAVGIVSECECVAGMASPPRPARPCRSPVATRARHTLGYTASLGEALGAVPALPPCRGRAASHPIRSMGSLRGLCPPAIVRAKTAGLLLGPAGPPRCAYLLPLSCITDGMLEARTLLRRGDALRDHSGVVRGTAWPK